MEKYQMKVNKNMPSESRQDIYECGDHSWLTRWVWLGLEGHCFSRESFPAKNWFYPLWQFTYFEFVSLNIWIYILAPKFDYIILVNT